MNTIPTISNPFSPARLSRPMQAALAACAALCLAAGAAAVSQHASTPEALLAAAGAMGADGFIDTPASPDEPMAAFGQ